MSTHTIDTDSEIDEILNDLRGGELYRRNVFRITGLPLDATARQIHRGKEEALMRARLASGTGDADDEADAVKDAFEAIRNPLLRLIHELLWAPVDVETAVDRHRTADRHRRLLENAPAHTMDLSPELAERWTDAVNGWLTIFDDEDIWQHARTRVQEIDDPRLTPKTIRRLRMRLPRHLAQVHVDLAVAAIDIRRDRFAWWQMKLLRTTNFDDNLLRSVLRESIRRAESDITDKVARAKDELQRTTSAKIGRTLHKETTATRKKVTLLLGREDPVTISLDTQVALTLNQCAVNVFELQKDIQGALKLLRSAYQMAIDDDTATLIDDNTRVIENEKRYRDTYPDNVAAAESENRVAWAFWIALITGIIFLIVMAAL